MSLLSRTLEKRRRRRTVSTLDSKSRIAVRGIESRIKLTLLSLLGAWIRPSKRSLPLPIRDVRSVLILRYDALGDAILATPVWRAIKEANPDIHIGVAGSVRNMAFLRQDESIDSTYIFSRGFSLSLLRELWHARKIKWDVVINLFFHDKTRGAIYAKLAAPHAVSVTMVRNHRALYEKIYSSAPERPQIRTPIVLQNIMAAQSVLTLPPSARDTLPTLPAHFQKGAFSAKGNYIILHIEASQDYKEWGMKNDLEFTRMILDRTDWNIFWTSSPARQKQCSDALANLKTDRARCLPTPSLEILAQVIGSSKAVVAPDTSVIHFATAQQVSVVGLYLEENDFLPYGGPSQVLFSRDRKNVSSIPPERVFQALEDLVAQNSATE